MRLGFIDHVTSSAPYPGSGSSDLTFSRRRVGLQNRKGADLAQTTSADSFYSLFNPQWVSEGWGRLHQRT